MTVESEWRRPPPPETSIRFADQLIVSRWIDERSQSREQTTDHAAGYYTIGLALRSTNLDFLVGGRTIHSGAVQCGMIQFGAPGVRVNAVVRAPCDFLHLWITNSFLEARCQELDVAPCRLTNYPGEFVFRRDAAITRLTHAILDARTPTGELYTEYVTGIASAIITRLITKQEEWSGRGPFCRACKLPQWRLKRAVDYVDAHLGEPMHLRDMANAAGLSRMHFASQFRAATGVRPREYLLRRRVDRAKDLLAGTDLTLVDIAMSIGFANQSHFSTVFGRMEGQTPGRWRRTNRRVTVVQSQKKALPEKTAIWSGSNNGEKGRKESLLT
ncbi:helix-turn-helix domain-containing protein [Reyranella soli]|nr:AraC family transcriptional regulator [Reyranella soli]